MSLIRQDDQLGSDTDEQGYTFWIGDVMFFFLTNVVILMNLSFEMYVIYFNLSYLKYDFN